MAAVPVDICGVGADLVWEQIWLGQATAHAGTCKSQDGVHAMLGLSYRTCQFTCELVWRVDQAGLGCCTYWQELGQGAGWAESGFSISQQMLRLGVGCGRLDHCTCWHAKDPKMGVSLVEELWGLPY